MPLPAREAVKSEISPLTTLFDAANIAQRALEKRLSHLRLSVAQERILALAYYAKESLTPSMLASLLLQETHSVSGLLNRLEDRDLISRSRDKQDRRVVWVALTPKGRQVAEEAIEISLEMSNEFKDIFAVPEVDSLLAVLRRVRDRGFGIAGVRDEVRAEALRRVWGNPGPV